MTRPDVRTVVWQAEDAGLLRFNGSQEQIASIRSVTAGATQPDPAPPQQAADVDPDV